MKWLLILALIIIGIQTLLHDSDDKLLEKYEAQTEELRLERCETLFLEQKLLDSEGEFDAADHIAAKRLLRHCINIEADEDGLVGYK